MKATFYDKTAHNAATIETIMMRPYYGAKKRTTFRLVQMDKDNVIYFVSCYETEDEAMFAMKCRGLDWEQVN